MAAMQLHHGLVNDAIENLQIALTLDPHQLRPRFNLAIAYVQTGDLSLALDQAEFILREKTKAERDFVTGADESWKLFCSILEMSGRAVEDYDVDRIIDGRLLQQILSAVKGNK